MENSNSWHTSDELNYLNNIGTHTVLGRSPHDRRELLEGYRDTLMYRPKSEKYLDVKRLRNRVEELLADA